MSKRRGPACAERGSSRRRGAAGLQVDPGGQRDPIQRQVVPRPAGVLQLPPQGVSVHEDLRAARHRRGREWLLFVDIGLGC